jgi:hypothetical protein
MKRRQYSSSIAFNDLLFNLLVGFVFLFIVAFILINPPTKRNDIPAKAEYIFVIEWDPESSDDIDLWVRDPNGVIVSFVNKEGGLLNLEKDDLGSANDSYTNPNGEVTVVKINREVTTMRGIIPGTYTVMAHVYSRPARVVFNNDTGRWDNLDELAPQFSPLSFQLIRVNPYQEVYQSRHRYITKGQQIPILEFDLSEDGVASNFRFPRESIITRGRLVPTSVADTFVSGGLSVQRQPEEDQPSIRTLLNGNTGP